MIPLKVSRKRMKRRRTQGLKLPTSPHDPPPIVKYKTATIQLRQPKDLNTGPRYHYNKKKKCTISDTTAEFMDAYSNCTVGSDFYSAHHKEIVTYTTEHRQNYAYIVDIDRDRYINTHFQKFVGRLLRTSTYRMIILVLVLFNAVMIGYNTFAENTREYKTPLQAIDHIIFTFFFFEIILKWIYAFRIFWKVWWNVLDFTIFALLLLSTMVPYVRERKDVFATIRVIRAFRILRSVNSLTSLSVVATTITRSVSDMVNILFVLIIFMFVMGISGVALFDFQELETQFFRTAFDAWYVLFICVTQDGWVQVLDAFRPDATDEHRELKAQYFVVISIFVMIGVTIGAFVFTNLIVAVVVANLEYVIKLTKEKELITEDPLSERHHMAVNMMDIVGIYDEVGENTLDLLIQRPIKVPSLRRVRPHIIQTYIALITGLEHNMLEFVLIERDIRRFLSVILTIGKQLQHDSDVAKYATMQSLDMQLLNSIYFLIELGVLKDISAPKPLKRVNIPALNKKSKRKQ